MQAIAQAAGESAPSASYIVGVTFSSFLSFFPLFLSLSSARVLSELEQETFNSGRKKKERRKKEKKKRKENQISKKKRRRRRRRKSRRRSSWIFQEEEDEKNNNRSRHRETENPEPKLGIVYLSASLLFFPRLPSCLERRWLRQTFWDQAHSRKKIDPVQNNNNNNNKKT